MITQAPKTFVKTVFGNYNTISTPFRWVEISGLQMISQFVALKSVAYDPYFSEDEILLIFTGQLLGDGVSDGTRFPPHANVRFSAPIQGLIFVPKSIPSEWGKKVYYYLCEPLRFKVEK